MQNSIRNALDSIRANYRLQIKIVRMCFKLVSRQEIFKLKLVALAQFGLSVVDLLSVAALGLVGSLTVYGIQSKDAEGNILAILRFLSLDSLAFQSQVGIIGGLAASMLVVRTIISSFIQFKTLRFLSLRSATITTRLISKLLNQKLNEINKRTSQENLFAVTTGVHLVTVGVIGTIVGIFSDISLLLVLVFGLMTLDPSTSIFTAVYFSVLGFILYFFSHRRAQIWARQETVLNINGNSKILEALFSFREMYTKGRKGWYHNQIARSRYEIAINQAKLSFLPNVSKYVLEIGLVVGGLSISAVQFLTKDASAAIASVSIFVVAAGRVAPAVLRLQQSLVVIKQNISGAKVTLDLIQEYGSSEDLSDDMPFDLIHDGFLAAISIQNINFRFDGKEKDFFSNFSLEVHAGEFIGLIGPSGSGKTTLVDLLLGILSVNSGQIEIAGKKPNEAIRMWPGAIAYVPQEVFLIQGSILQNVTLGYDNSDIDVSRVEQCLKQAELWGYVSGLPRGVNSEIGERGSNLSGGQRQRIGIARALYSNPKLLILDEATSALDWETEKDINDTLLKFKGEKTIVVIAHRLASIVRADRLIYLDKGTVVADGTVEAVRAKVASFDRQFRLQE
jgi:ABC-type multidrug transport system fused ATPase/permease subunit